MRQIALIIIFLTLTKVSLANDVLKKADEAYDSKKYTVAIDNYEALIKDGFQSPQLFYNLGNAYYRNNDLGKAIYNYELARKLEPNDEDIKVNLAKVCAKTIDKIDSKENFFISAVKTNVLSSFSTKSWAWLSIITCFFTCAFLFLFISMKQKVIKRTSFLLALVFAFSFCLFYFFGYSSLKAKYNNKFAIILVKESKIFNEPTLTATSKFILHEGTKIRLVENSGDWALIKLDNGNEGWIKKIEIGVI